MPGIWCLGSGAWDLVPGIWCLGSGDVMWHVTCLVTSLEAHWLGADVSQLTVSLLLYCFLRFSCTDGFGAISPTPISPFHTRGFYPQNRRVRIYKGIDNIPQLFFFSSSSASGCCTNWPSLPPPCKHCCHIIKCPFHRPMGGEGSRSFTWTPLGSPPTLTTLYHCKCHRKSTCP